MFDIRSGDSEEPARSNLNTGGMVSARPCRDNTLWQRQGGVRPQSLTFLISALGSTLLFPLLNALEAFECN